MLFKYILKRFLIMIPTLIIISIISFIIIQLPPGDMATAYLSRLSEGKGFGVGFEMAEQLKKSFGLDQPLYMQYFKWIWKFMHGDFGFTIISFSASLMGTAGLFENVNQIIKERLGWTVGITLLSLIYAWILGLGIGIYSARHQYSISDYIFTFFGFIGLAVPGFLLALILMWLGSAYFHISVGGIFSMEYQNAPWSLGKIIDLLKHTSIPALIVGMAGTAGIVRTMRATLLDELRKPYVTTARAKGLKERRLIFKYPVRIAINPFLSTIGWLLPALFGGEAIVSTVLNMPTMGPVLLKATLSQEMYLITSYIMLTSFFTVIGTLISDILLAIADPRIRYE
jgi:peptide/nickel transport system permease protein